MVSRRGLVKNFCAASPRDLDALIRRCAAQPHATGSINRVPIAETSDRDTSTSVLPASASASGWLEAVALLQGALYLNMVPTRQSYRGVMDLVARQSHDVRAMRNMLGAMSASTKTSVALERYLLRALANHQPALGLELLLSASSHQPHVDRTIGPAGPQRGALHKSTWMDRTSIEAILSRVVQHHPTPPAVGTGTLRWARTLELLPLLEEHRVPPTPAMIDAFLCACTATHQWQIAARLITSAVKTNMQVTPRMAAHVLKCFDGSDSSPWGHALRFVTRDMPTQVLQDTRVLMSMAGVLSRAGQWMRALAAADRVVVQMGHADKEDGCDVLNASLKHLPWTTALRYFARVQHLATADTKRHLLAVLAGAASTQPGAHAAAAQFMRRDVVAATVGLRSDAATLALGWASSIALICDAHGNTLTRRGAAPSATDVGGLDLASELISYLGRHSPRCLATPPVVELSRQLTEDRRQSVVKALVASGAWQQGIAIALQPTPVGARQCAALVNALAHAGYWEAGLRFCRHQSDALEGCLAERGLWKAAIVYAIDLGNNVPTAAEQALPVHQGAPTALRCTHDDALGSIVPADDDGAATSAPVSTATITTLRQFVVPLCASLSAYEGVASLLQAIGTTTNMEALLLDKAHVVREEGLLLHAASSSCGNTSDRGSSSASVVWDVFERHRMRGGPLPLSPDVVAAVGMRMLEHGYLDRLEQTLQYAASKGMLATADNRTSSTQRRGVGGSEEHRHAFDLLTTFQWARGPMVWGGRTSTRPTTYEEVIRRLEKRLAEGRSDAQIRVDEGHNEARSATSTMDHVMMVVAAAALVVPTTAGTDGTMATGDRHQLEEVAVEATQLQPVPLTGAAVAAADAQADPVVVSLQLLAWLMSGDGDANSAVADAVCRCKALVSHVDGAMARCLEQHALALCASSTGAANPGSCHVGVVEVVDTVVQWLMVHVVTASDVGARHPSLSVGGRLHMVARTIAVRARLLPGGGAFAVGAVEQICKHSGVCVHDPSAIRLLKGVAAALPHDALHLWARLLHVASPGVCGALPTGSGVPVLVLRGAAEAYARGHMWRDAVQLLHTELAACVDATRSSVLVSQIHALEAVMPPRSSEGHAPRNQSQRPPQQGGTRCDDAVAALVAQSPHHWAAAVDLLLHHGVMSDGTTGPIQATHGTALTAVPSSAILRRVLIACMDATHDAQRTLALMHALHDRFAFSPQPQDFSAMFQTISNSIAEQQGDALLRQGMLVVDAMQTKYRVAPSAADYRVLTLLCAWASDSALRQALQVLQKASTAVQGAQLLRVVQTFVDAERDGGEDGHVNGERLQRAFDSTALRLDAYWTPQRLGKIAGFVPELEAAAAPLPAATPGGSGSDATPAPNGLADVAERLSTAVFQGTVPSQAIIDVWGQPAKRERLKRMHHALHSTRWDASVEVPTAVLCFAATFAPWIRYGSTKFVNERAVAHLGHAVMAEWPVHRLRTVLNVNRKDVLRLLSKRRRAATAAAEASNDVWTDAAIDDLLQGSPRLFVRLGPFALLPPSRDVLEAVASTVFHHTVDVAVLGSIWPVLVERAKRMQAARWPAAAEAELVAKVVEMEGGCPSVLALQPSASPQAIADYWDTYSTVLLPSATFNTVEMRYVAERFYPDLAAAAADNNSNGLTELCNNIAATTFSADPLSRPQHLAHVPCGGCFGHHSGQDVLQLWLKSNAAMADWFRTSMGYALQLQGDSIVGTATEVVVDGSAGVVEVRRGPLSVVGTDDGPSCTGIAESHDGDDDGATSAAPTASPVTAHRWQAAMALLAQSLHHYASLNDPEDWPSQRAPVLRSSDSSAPNSLVPLLLAVAKTGVHDGLSVAAMRSLMDPLLLGGVPAVVWRMLEDDGEVGPSAYALLTAHDAAVLDRARPLLPPPMVDALSQLLYRTSATGTRPMDEQLSECVWTLATLLRSLVLSTHQRTAIWGVLTECQCMRKLPPSDPAARRALIEALWLGCEK